MTFSERLNLTIHLQQKHQKLKMWISLEMIKKEIESPNIEKSVLSSEPFAAWGLTAFPQTPGRLCTHCPLLCATGWQSSFSFSQVKCDLQFRSRETCRRWTVGQGHSRH